MTLGERLKLRRTYLGLTQKKLSEMSGIAQPYISELECEKFKPTSVVIAALATSLNCTADYLIFGDTDEFDAAETAV